MKHIIFIAFLFCTFSAWAQYPTHPTKQELGRQTTGDGLTFRGSGSPAYTPTNKNNAWMFLDTLSGTLYAYRGGSWQLVNAGGVTDVSVSNDTLYITTTDSTFVAVFDDANTNFANSNLTFTGNRVHNLSTRTLTIADGGTYPTFQQSAATDGFTLASSATDLIAQTPGLLQIENSDTITITADRIRMNAADTRIQQVSKSNTLNRVMMIDSITERVYYRDVSSIAGGGGANTNFAENNLTATGDRSHAFANYDLVITAIDSLSFSFAKRISLNQNSQRLLHQTGGGLGGSVFENLFFGYQAGALADVAGTGYANTAIGRRSGYNLTTVNAGGLTSSSSNTLLGYGSGEALTNGTGNTFLGTAAGGNTGTGVYANTYVGWHAGLNATGSYNTFVGREAGNSATSSESTFGGYAAGYNTTGTQNTFYGTNSGRVGTAHRRNAYFGHSAGEWLSSSSEENVFVGWRAGGGAANVSAGYNTIVGSEAGFALTSGNTNTFIGRNAGKAVTSGSNNVYIGNNGGNTMTTGSNNTIIDGAGINLPSNTQSNSLLLTRDIYASGINSSIRAGIGSGTFRDPKATLSVRSFTRTTVDTIFSASNSLSGADAFDVFFITADGGFVSQQASGVAVSGTPLARFIGNFTATGSSNTGWGTMTASPTINETSLDTTWSYKANPTLTSASDFISFWTNNDSGVGFASTGTATNYFRGNVGIGSGTYPTPARTLHVTGEARITDLNTDNPTRIVGADADGDLGSITVGSGLSLSSGTLSATGGAGTTNLAFSGSSSPVTLTSDTGTDVIFAAGSGLALSQSGGTATYSRTYSLTHITITGGSTFFGTTAERPDNDTPGSATTSTVGSDFSVSGSTINYTGGSGALLRVEGSISFSVADDGDYYLSIYKEGSELGATSMRVSCVAGNYYSISLPATTTSGSTNDTFDLRIATVSGNSTTTMHRYGFIIERIY